MPDKPAQSARSIQAALPAQPAPSGVSRPTLTGPRLTTLLSLVLGVFGAAWILLHSPNADAWLARPVPDGLVAARRRDDRQREQNMLRRMEANESFRAPLTPPVALYTANLTDRVGDYIVSARRTRTLNYTWDDNPPLGYLPVTPAPVYLSIQVMSARPDALRRILSIAKGLTVTDSDGQRLTPELSQEFAFPNGRGCRLRLPPCKAAFLRRVDGLLTLTPAAPQHTTEHNPDKDVDLTSLPFHIVNVPLPWTSHMYGMASAAVLDEQTAAGLGLQMPRLPLPSRAVSAGAVQPPPAPPARLIAGARVEAVLRHLPRAAFDAPDLPLTNRLVIQPDAPCNVLLRLVSGADSAGLRPLLLSCGLTIKPAGDGELVTTLRLQAGVNGPLEQTFSVWDDRPVIVAVPLRLLCPDQAHSTWAQSSRWALVYLHLFSDDTPRYVTGESATPRRFLAAPSTRGGALAGRLVANGEGIGPGSATLSLARLRADGQADGTEEAVQISLNDEGRFALPNVAAGRYRLALGDVRPDVGRLGGKPEFTSYLKHRWRITSPVPEPVMQETSVGPGEHKELTPWSYHNPAHSVQVQEQSKP